MQKFHSLSPCEVSKFGRQRQQHDNDTNFISLVCCYTWTKSLKTSTDDHHHRARDCQDEHDHNRDDFMMIIHQAPAQSLDTPAAEEKRQQRGADR